MADSAIAKLMIQILGDTTGLEGATKKANSLTNELTKGLTGALPANIAQFATLGGAIVGVSAFLKSAVDDTMKYAQSVRDLSQVSGMSAEETSRFIQVLDDYQLTTEDALAATRAMTKNGLVPSMDTLARLSDQYRAISGEQEKNAFIIKNLGRAGLQWVNVLNQGGAALRAQSAAVSQSLVLSAAAVRQAEDYRLAVDSLGDSWEGLKVSIGTSVIPALTDLVGNLKIGADFVAKYKNELILLYRVAHGFMLNPLEAFNAPFDYQKAQIIDTAAALGNLTDKGGNWDGAQQHLTLTTQEQTSANTQLLSSMMSVQNARDSYSKSMQGGVAAYNEATAAVNQYVAANGAQGPEYDQLVAKQADAKKSLDDLTTSYQKAMRLMAFNLISDGLKSLPGGIQLIAQMGERMGVMDHNTSQFVFTLGGIKDQLAAGGDQAKLTEQALSAVDNLTIADKNFNVNLTTSINGAPATTKNGHWMINGKNLEDLPGWKRNSFLNGKGELRGTWVTDSAAGMTDAAKESLTNYVNQLERDMPEADKTWTNHASAIGTATTAITGVDTATNNSETNTKSKTDLMVTEWTGVKGEIDLVTGAVGLLGAAISSLHDKTINITMKVNGSTAEFAPFMATAIGGMFGGSAGLAYLRSQGMLTSLSVGHDAVGGPAAGLTLVGERGPELVHLPGGSHVYPNGQSMAMMKASQSASGITMNLNIMGQGVIADPQSFWRQLQPTVQYGLRSMGVI